MQNDDCTTLLAAGLPYTLMNTFNGTFLSTMHQVTYRYMNALIDWRTADLCEQKKFKPVEYDGLQSIVKPTTIALSAGDTFFSTRVSLIMSKRIAEILPTCV